MRDEGDRGMGVGGGGVFSLFIVHIVHVCCMELGGGCLIFSWSCSTLVWRWRLRGWGGGGAALRKGQHIL